MNEKIEKYYAALDALIELSEYEGGHITAAINHLRDRIASLQSEQEED